MPNRASIWNVLGAGLVALAALLAFVSFVMMVRRLQNTDGVRNRSIFDGVQRAHARRVDRHLDISPCSASGSF